MNRLNALQTSTGALIAVVSAVACCAMTPAELEQQLARGGKITAIDIRSTSLFQKGHIPGAINVPASLIPQKQLPPMGRVVVYDSGLGGDEAGAAVTALNRKKGIQAEVLEGGFASWETNQGLTTRESGLHAEELPMISYEQLKKSQGAHMVLVDLRKASKQPELQSAGGTVTNQSLTDLHKTFPMTRGVTTSPLDLPRQRQAAGATTEPPLLVLIDSGDGVTAREMARTLRANGLKRVVILAGGEAVLAHEGKPGLQRLGTTLEYQRSNK